MKTRLYCYLLITSIVFLSTQVITLYASRLPNASSEQVETPGTGLADDSNIQIIGRWDTSQSPSVIKGYWPGVYIKTQITGTVRLSIQVVGPVTFYFQINNGTPRLLNNVNGTVILSTGLTAANTYTIRFMARTETDIFRFQRLIMDAGATTIRPPNNNGIIEFVGDSITAGKNASMGAVSSYARLTANNLNMDYVNISYTGVCLVDGVTCGWTTGMSRAYFKMQTLPFNTSPDWDFTRYQSRAVVINLGTNDDAYGVPDAQYYDSYVNFLASIRSKYPNAHIFVLRTFNGLKVVPAHDAVNARVAAGDTMVHYVDTTGWVNPSTDYVDTYHLNDSGHTKVAGFLSNVIRSIVLPPVLKLQYMTNVVGSVATQIEPYFRIVNTGSSSAPLSDLKIRYWFTRDLNQPLLFRCTYARIGCANVSGNVVSMTVPRQNADTYVEVGFNTGTVPENGNSDAIQILLRRSDWSSLTQTNDYSFDPTKRAYADWTKVTLYDKGVLIWGTEPGDTLVPTNTPAPVPTNTPAPGGITLKMQYRTTITASTSTQIEPQFVIANTTGSSIPLAELKIRYWFTRDSNQTLQTRCVWAMMNCTNVKPVLVLMSGPRVGADTYLEVGFNGGSLAPNGTTGEIQTIINRTDWSNLNQSNDYSFDPSKTAYADWTKVTLYRNGTLIWGTEP
jgi:hypothetical protein